MSKIATENRIVRLTDTQLIALSSAALRNDGAIIVPDRIKGNSPLKLAKKLIDLGLAREIKAEPGMLVNRRDDDGGGLALLITEAGKSAINAAEDSEEAKQASPHAGREEIVESTHSVDSGASDGLEDGVDASAGAHAKEPPSESATPSPSDPRGADDTGSVDRAPVKTGYTPPRPGTKIAKVIALLERPEGAKIDDIITVTGWMPHTTRAALTGLRKRGYAVARQGGPKDGGAVYRIDGSPRNEAA